MIYSFSPFGYEGALVSVEVDLRRGVPMFDIVGLPDGAVSETRERVKASIINSKLKFPHERILVSLSPADLKKEGAGFDLPVALGVLSQMYDYECGKQVLVMGELELSGKVRSVKGVGAALATASSCGIKYAIVPRDENLEVPSGIKVRMVDSLEQALCALADLKAGSTGQFKEGSVKKYEFKVEFSDDYENSFDSVPQNLRFALTVAVAGHHNILAVGGPGCGNSLGMQQLPLLTPNLTGSESESVNRIWSLAGLPRHDNTRPFRMPHQTASLEGICGGGYACRPGEVSLAHNGILFLDEAAEFRSAVLQMLRCPIESGTITLSRAGRSTTYPAHFQLAMATNPCPCGNYGSKTKICLCSHKSIEQYWNKFSAPLLDRMQIRCFVDDEKTYPAYTLEEAREHIKIAWERQYARQGKLNQDLAPNEIMDNIKLSEEARQVLDSQMARYGLSPRAVSDITKLSRTLCDMHFNDTDVVMVEEMRMACELRKTDFRNL